MTIVGRTVAEPHTLSELIEALTAVRDAVGDVEISISTDADNRMTVWRLPVPVLPSARWENCELCGTLRMVAMLRLVSIDYGPAVGMVARPVCDTCLSEGGQ